VVNGGVGDRYGLCVVREVRREVFESVEVCGTSFRWTARSIVGDSAEGGQCLRKRQSGWGMRDVRQLSDKRDTGALRKLAGGYFQRCPLL